MSFLKNHKTPDYADIRLLDDFVHVVAYGLGVLTFYSCFFAFSLILYHSVYHPGRHFGSIKSPILCKVQHFCAACCCRCVNNVIPLAILLKCNAFLAARRCQCVNKAIPSYFLIFSYICIRKSIKTSFLNAFNENSAVFRARLLPGRHNQPRGLAERAH